VTQGGRARAGQPKVSRERFERDALPFLDQLYAAAQNNPQLVKLEVLGHTGQGREIIVELTAPLHVGDGVGFESPTERGGASVGFTVTTTRTSGPRVHA